ncbi:MULTISPECIES: nickel-responsive transcriptional regulator NikR [Halomonadaceae]|uniref:nickel-responsive transcriptional regulator NikR n=1 Tax=Halomonadaceae TaxID=28256 RepID=UPI001597AEAE|nr:MULTISPECIES: nickel-responsive transcriptional regulator NikR [Halomonas]QJQ95744.1 nickel-responsive transcriptional regulator NikR [Halomonas sp. PA5]
MQRVTVTLDDDLMADLDQLIAQRGYQNRSEAIRDLARAGLKEMVLEGEEEQPCVGALVYVYDHAARELSKRLTHHSHAHHHLTVSTLHVHLDHDSCLEMAVLKGRGREVRAFSSEVISERSVRHGQLILMPDHLEG